MQSVLSRRFGQALLALAVLLAAAPAAAFDLFARHEVTVHFATAAGKPLADADVRVFAPGDPTHPALTGRTDSRGRFTFPADADGFWSAEARTGQEVVRIMVRVGDEPARKPPSPYWVLAGLGLMLVLAVVFRILRARLLRTRR